MADFNSNEKQELNRIAGQLLIAQTDKMLTDANVTAANTVAGLRAAVNAASPIGAGAGIDFSGYEMRRARTLRAITAGVDLGIFTDAAILNLTTVAALIALTGVPSTYKTRSFYD
jgi:hypothetical protein